MDSPLISTRSLNIWYNGLHALKDVNMDVPVHSITSLIGASGSGKSTLLRSLNRMLDTVALVSMKGEILVRGKNVLEETTNVIELRRMVGMVFQNPTPFPKSVFDNVAYGLEIQGIRRERRKFLRSRKIDPEVLEQSTHPLNAAVVRSLKEAALWDEVKYRLHQSAYRLSGGQQQRLCIARAIAVRPRILLLDEPCSELDPISTHKIEDLLLQLKSQYTIVIVTHNMHQARRISDYVGFFHMGELLEFGTTADIFDHPKDPLTAQYVHGEFG